MATPRRLEAYPNWMLNLAQSFDRVEAPVRREVIHADNPAMARRYRQQLYGFIRALEREGILKDYPNFSTVRLVLDGADLHIMHVDEYLPQPKGMQ